MAIPDLHHTVRSGQQETRITTTPGHTTAVTQGGKLVVEPTLEPVRTTDCGPDLFLDAQVSITIGGSRNRYMEACFSGGGKGIDFLEYHGSVTGDIFSLA